LLCLLIWVFIQSKKVFFVESFYFEICLDEYFSMTINLSFQKLTVYCLDVNTFYWWINVKLFSTEWFFIKLFPDTNSMFLSTETQFRHKRKTKNMNKQFLMNKKTKFPFWFAFKLPFVLSTSPNVSFSEFHHFLYC
jgi:hypothetical protein